jgi:hypothetical protein
MDAITTAGLVLGIATKGEPKPVLCDAPTASTIQIKRDGRKRRLTGQGVITPPNLGPPLLGLIRH